MIEDVNALSGEDAKIILRNLKAAAHAAINHPPCRGMKTRDNEYMIMCCGLGCPIHFSMILREQPDGGFSNSWMFLNFFLALWEPETQLRLAENGMELHTAAGSASVVLGGLHG